MNNKYAVIIPCYNHAQAIPSVLNRLEQFKLTTFVVDDGNSTEQKELLKDNVAKYAFASLISLDKNEGKGGAVFHGAEMAMAQGFTHIIQLDADGQHKIEDLPKLISLSEQYPQDLISAMPQYDESVPKSRLYGRYITHFWVWIETLSLNIKDSMCGFRIYPNATFLSCFKEELPGKRMDFDIEIMVRMYWRGTKCHFMESPVTYPLDGISNFDVLKDNLAISRMHTKLCLMMPYRMYRLMLSSVLSPDKGKNSWADKQEQKGLLGMKIMMRLYIGCGRVAFMTVLPFVIAFFYLFAPKVRHASAHYLQIIKKEHKKRNIASSLKYSTYKHMLSFGITMLDKLALWRKDAKVIEAVEYAQDAQQVLAPTRQKGKLILGSHLGNLDAARALAIRTGLPKVTALVFTDNAERFKAITKEFAPAALEDLIAVNSITPELACELSERIERGEYVAITGDRISPIPGRGGIRCVKAPFLGHECEFPEGPFILASLLKCPVIATFALKEQGKIRIYAQKLADEISLPRKTRNADLKEYIKQYASVLEAHTLTHPYEWFNFYNFPGF